MNKKIICACYFIEVVWDLYLYIPPIYLIFIRQMATPPPLLPGSEISIKNRSPNRFLYLCVYPLNLKRQFLLGDVPPWLYLRVFFAVGLPKERALSTLVSRWSQHTTHGTVCDPWSHSIVFKFMRISIFKSLRTTLTACIALSEVFFCLYLLIFNALFRSCLH